MDLHTNSLEMKAMCHALLASQHHLLESSSVDVEQFNTTGVFKQTSGHCHCNCVA